MHDQQITAIILAAREMGGMGDEYFENKTRHLLPIANKPLIQHLIETVGNCEDVAKKYTIIIDENVEKYERKKSCEEVYKSIFGDRIGKDIELVGQDPLTQVGTFEAVRRYVDEYKKEDTSPLLILYGDTLVEETFLKYIIGQYYDEQEKSSEEQKRSIILWGLVESKKKRGKFVVTKQIDINSSFRSIKGNSVINIFEYPLPIERDEPYSYLHDTGIMLISKDAWDDINRLIERIHRPSPLGLFSFTSIIKQALAFKNVKIEGMGDIDIKLTGIVASEDCWCEANYPWEILELNKLKIPDLTKDAEWTGEEDNTLLIQENTEWAEEKEKEIGERIILVRSGVIFSVSNGARIKGPCILRKNIEIHDYAVIECSYIGDGCKIGAHTLIRDSTLYKNVKVNHDAIIEKSIIMDDSVICYHAEVLHSIIGKEVMIGSDVKTPCQRLKKVEGEPVYQSVTYFSDIGIKRTEKFGAIVGDYCQIGSGTVIHPGRRIGKRSTIYANCEILKNIKPHSDIRNKDLIAEGYD